MTVTVKPNGYRDILTTDNAAEWFLNECRSTKKSLGLLLEEADPSSTYVAEPVLKDLDAFERQMYFFGIRTKPDMDYMLPASTLDEFLNPKGAEGDPTRLGHGDGQRFFASNQPQSWVLYPEFINRQIRIVPLPGDVLDSIVATVTPIDTDLYKAIYLNDPIATLSGRRLWRVSEGAEIPIGVTLNTSETGIKLNKYGLTIKSTYEVFRRLRIDLFTIMLARVAQQIKLDLSTQGLNTIVNGDGNGNPALNSNVSALDPTAPAGPGTVTDQVTGTTSSITKGLTYKAWLMFRAALYPLEVNTIIGRLNELLQVLTLQFPNVDPMTLMAVLQQQRGASAPIGGELQLNQPIFKSDVNLVYHPWAPGGMLIGIDKNFALEQLIEKNSAITETDKDIRSQINEIVVSQVTGFAKFLPAAAATLTFA